jgi:hypothetical protein
MNCYTKQEAASINAAWGALEGLCDMAHGETTELHRALKLEKAQASPVQEQPVIWARARVVKHWHKGATSPDMPVSEACDYRPGVLAALMLGASHASRLEHGSETRGRRHSRAIDKAPAAIEAYEAQWQRALDAIKRGE